MYFCSLVLVDFTQMIKLLTLYPSSNLKQKRWIHQRNPLKIIILPPKHKTVSFLYDVMYNRTMISRGFNNVFVYFCHHDDVIKWKKSFPRYWPFVRGIQRSPVNSPHKGQWHGVLMVSLISAWLNGWVNNDESGDLRRHRAHYEVTVMTICIILLRLAQIINAHCLVKHNIAKCHSCYNPIQNHDRYLTSQKTSQSLQDFHKTSH